jgi:transposase-like protein
LEVRGMSWYERRVYSEADRGYGLAAIICAGGNMSQASRISGVPRPTLYLWRQEYGLRRASLARMGLSVEAAETAGVVVLSDGCQRA